jgi:ABC-type lipoprotein release transport system permease subunit
MRGGVHRIVAVCRDLESVARVKSELRKEIADMQDTQDLVVLDWRELNPGLVQAIQMDLVSGFIFYVILIVVVAFSILNTFLMAIFERTREFGVMMALGTSPARLTRLLLFESSTITLIGIATGIVLGGWVTWYFQIHGIVIPGAEEMARQFGLPERMYPQLSVLSVSVGAGIVLVITLITALYPALKVRRLKPVRALSAV